MSFRVLNMTLFLVLIMLISAVLYQNIGIANEGDQETIEYRESLRTFNKTLALIEAKYVQEKSSEILMQSAIEEMLHRLDPYTQFLDLREHKELQIDTQGKYGGIGLSIDIRDNVLTAISPIEGSPAFKAGIQAGDKIIAVDGEPTEGLSIDECVDVLRGDPGTTVILTIEREGFDEAIEFRLVRDIIEIKSVPYYTLLSGRSGEGVGYIKLTQFSQGTSQELEEALVDLEEEGITSLILDLRGNPGGLLNQAVHVVEKFVGSGKEVVSTNGRMPEASREWWSRRGATHPEFPLVVLIDEGSASASEIVAGAIQDWDRGIIIGSPSFGKGSVQTVYELDSGDALKLTTARYYTPSGRCIHKDDNEFTREFFPDAGEAMKTQNITKSGTGEYYTKINHRLVEGGGGIIPDLEIEPDTLSLTMREIEIKALPFKFAVHYTVDHEISSQDFMVTENMLNAFYQMAEEEGVFLNEVKRGENRDEIAYAIRREILSKIWGSDARYQEVLKHDQQIAQAIELLQDQNRFSKWISGELEEKRKE